jgi:hypothetical protein
MSERLTCRTSATPSPHLLERGHDIHAVQEYLELLPSLHFHEAFPVPEGLDVFALHVRIASYTRQCGANQFRMTP